MKKAGKKRGGGIDSELVRQRLKLRTFEERASFAKKYTEASEFLKSRGLDLGKIRDQSAKLLGTGAVAGTLLLSSPQESRQLPELSAIVTSLNEGEANVKVERPSEVLVRVLGEVLPEKKGSLGEVQEKYLEELFEKVVGVKARAKLEGEHLNTTYGMIGAEQHLRRFPGDVLVYHRPGEGEYGEENPGEMIKEGIAPGLGAWGYFAPSKTQLSEELAEIEKWYVVVPTMYLPDWNERTKYLRDWYKYRKVLVVNTENGKAVVGAIADAGPAAWTGKQFGGSPEVMDYLGGPRYKKGVVVMFFVDESEGGVPLGPVEYDRGSVVGEEA